MRLVYRLARVINRDRLVIARKNSKPTLPAPVHLTADALVMVTRETDPKEAKTTEATLPGAEDAKGQSTTYTVRNVRSGISTRL